MLKKIDPSVLTAIMSRKDKNTVILAVSTALAFGAVIGALAIYEHLLQQLKESNLD